MLFLILLPEPFLIENQRKHILGLKLRKTGAQLTELSINSDDITAWLNMASAHCSFY